LKQKKTIIEEPLNAEVKMRDGSVACQWFGVKASDCYSRNKVDTFLRNGSRQLGNHVAQAIHLSQPDASANHLENAALQKNIPNFQ